MNYLKTYINLIRVAESKPSDKITSKSEKHHVFPVSIFGKNSWVVVLSTREHFVCHKLLYLICKKRYGERHVNTFKMFKALWMMSFSRGLSISSHMVSKYREEHFNAMLKQYNPWRGQNHTEKTKTFLREINSRQNNSFFGKTHTPEVKKLIGDLHRGKKIPKEICNKMSQSRRGRKNGRAILREWEHETEGRVEACISELVSKYPQHNLDAQSLRKLIKRKNRVPYKGWLFVSEVSS